VAGGSWLLRAVSIWMRHSFGVPSLWPIYHRYQITLDMTSNSVADLRRLNDDR
jgi:hypothetical protein